MEADVAHLRRLPTRAAFVCIVDTAQHSAVRVDEAWLERAAAALGQLALERTDEPAALLQRVALEVLVPLGGPVASPDHAAAHAVLLALLRYSVRGGGPLGFRVCAAIAPYIERRSLGYEATVAALICAAPSVEECCGAVRPALAALSCVLASTEETEERERAISCLSSIWVAARARTQAAAPAKLRGQLGLRGGVREVASSSPLSSGCTVLTGPGTALRVALIVAAHALTVGSTRAAPDQAHGVRSHSRSVSGIRGARGVRWASIRASARSVQPQYGRGDALQPLRRHRRPERARRNVGAEALTTVTTVTTVPDRPTVPDRLTVRSPYGREVPESTVHTHTHAQHVHVHAHVLR